MQDFILNALFFWGGGTFAISIAALSIVHLCKKRRKTQYITFRVRREMEQGKGTTLQKPDRLLMHL